MRRRWCRGRQPREGVVRRRPLHLPLDHLVADRAVQAVAAAVHQHGRSRRLRHLVEGDHRRGLCVDDRWGDGDGHRHGQPCSDRHHHDAGSPRPGPPDPRHALHPFVSSHAPVPRHATPLHDAGARSVGVDGRSFLARSRQCVPHRLVRHTCRSPGCAAARRVGRGRSMGTRVRCRR